MSRHFEEPTELMRAWAQAVTDNDPEMLGDVFAADAEFVNLFGSIWEGRQAIIDGHAWALGSVLKDSSMQFETVETRPLSGEVVVMRGVCQRGRAADASAETLPPGTTILLVVARRDQDGWKAVSGANVARQPPAP